MCIRDSYSGGTEESRQIRYTYDCHDDVLVRDPCGGADRRVDFDSVHCGSLLDLSADMDLVSCRIFYLL